MIITLIPPAEVVDDLTRRDLLAAGLAGLLASACGPSSNDEASPPDDDAGAAVTVEHVGGATEVPLAPNRIVTLDGFVDLQTLLVFAVDPVLAGVDEGLRDGFLAGRLDEVGEVVGRGIDNLEQIAAARPELILSAEYDIERYDDLSAIAPTVLIDRYGLSVDDHLRLIGRVLGRKEQAEAATATFRARLSAVSVAVLTSQLAEMTIGMVARNNYAGTISAFGPRSYGGRTLVEVGAGTIIEPGGASDGDDFAFGSDLSAEQLGTFEPARLILLHVDRYYEAEADNVVEKQPLWPTLPAVVAGQVIEIDADVWHQDTALTRMARLDDIERIARDLA